MIVDECPCNLCSNLRVYDVDENEDEDDDDDVAQLVVLLSAVEGLTCPDDDDVDDDDDDCERAVEKGDVQLYKYMMSSLVPTAICPYIHSHSKRNILTHF